MSTTALTTSLYLRGHLPRPLPKRGLDSSIDPFGPGVCCLSATGVRESRFIALTASSAFLSVAIMSDSSTASKLLINPNIYNPNMFYSRSSEFPSGLMSERIQSPPTKRSMNSSGKKLYKLDTRPTVSFRLPCDAQNTLSSTARSQVVHYSSEEELDKLAWREYFEDSATETSTTQTHGSPNKRRRLTSSTSSVVPSEESADSREHTPRACLSPSSPTISFVEDPQSTENDLRAHIRDLHSFMTSSGLVLSMSLLLFRIEVPALTCSQTLQPQFAR